MFKKLKPILNKKFKKIDDFFIDRLINIHSTDEGNKNIKNEP